MRRFEWYSLPHASLLSHPLIALIPFSEALWMKQVSCNFIVFYLLSRFQNFFRNYLLLLFFNLRYLVRIFVGGNEMNRNGKVFFRICTLCSCFIEVTTCRRALWARSPLFQSTPRRDWSIWVSLQSVKPDELFVTPLTAANSVLMTSLEFCILHFGKFAYAKLFHYVSF